MRLRTGLRLSLLLLRLGLLTDLGPVLLAHVLNQILELLRAQGPEVLITELGRLALSALLLALVLGLLLAALLAALAVVLDTLHGQILAGLLQPLDLGGHVLDKEDRVGCRGELVLLGLVLVDPLLGGLGEGSELVKILALVEGRDGATLLQDILHLLVLGGILVFEAIKVARRGGGVPLIVLVNLLTHGVDELEGLLQGAPKLGDGSGASSTLCDTLLNRVCNVLQLLEPGLEFSSGSIGALIVKPLAGGTGLLREAGLLGFGRGGNERLILEQVSHLPSSWFKASSRRYRAKSEAAKAFNRSLDCLVCSLVNCGVPRISMTISTGMETVSSFLTSVFSSSVEPEASADWDDSVADLVADSSDLLLVLLAKSEKVLDTVDKALLDFGLTFDSGLDNINFAVLGIQLGPEAEGNATLNARGVLFLERRDARGQVLGGETLQVLVLSINLLVESTAEVSLLIEGELLGGATDGRDGGPETLGPLLACLPLQTSCVAWAIRDSDFLDTEAWAEVGGAETSTKHGGLVRVDIGAELLSLFQGAVDGNRNSVSMGLSQRLEIGALDLVLEIHIVIEAFEAGGRVLVGAQNMANTLSLLGQLGDGPSVGPDALGGNRGLLCRLGLDKLLNHVVDDEVVEGITAQSAVGTGSNDLNLLDSLVELSNVLDLAALEPHDGRLGRARTHVEDHVVFGFPALVDVGELAGGGVVETNSQTIADGAENPQASEVGSSLYSAPLICGIEWGNGQDNGAHRGAIASCGFGILLNALKLHGEQLFNQPGILLR
ncbi:unnamed protein product [Clonostachys byssicola]|uniref:Uncharacterized protein n=1 Tax=Clonostachys byssicola TaxID=160290 RepID=A0A9N9U4R0_9HYPO|nr:unnamed protein product [Clonostachys byssicola]